MGVYYNSYLKDFKEFRRSVSHVVEENVLFSLLDMMALRFKETIYKKEMKCYSDFMYFFFLTIMHFRSDSTGPSRYANLPSKNFFFRDTVQKKGKFLF